SHRRLRHPLELGELGHATGTAAQDAEDLAFGAGDLGVAHLLDEQPHEQRSAREQMARDVVDLLRPLRLRIDAPGPHIYKLYSIMIYSSIPQWLQPTKGARSCFATSSWQSTARPTPI